jgi:heptosyltransferase I
MTRLLILKPSSLGDIVHGLQLAASLQEQVADLTIDWVVRDLFAPLVQQAVAVDRTYVFQRRGGLAGFIRLLRQLRRTRYDLVFDLQGLLRSGLMTAAARAPLKVGRSDAREGAGLFYDRRVPLPPAGRNSHAVERLLQFAPVLGAEPEARGRVTFKSGAEGEPLFEGAGPRPVLMFPDSRRPEKCWPYFEALTERLLEQDATVRIGWAGSVRQAGRPEWPAERFANRTGLTPLAALPSLIEQAALVVANDSGPMHLAAAMGVPVVGIFGPTDPRQYGPYPVGAPGREVIQAPGGRLTDLSPEVMAERVRAGLGV